MFKMKRVFLSLIIQICVFIITCKAQSFQLNSSIEYTNPIIKGQYENVTATVKNIGATITVDFECDLVDQKGNFKTVIGKICNKTITAGSTITLKFNSGTLAANPIDYTAGSYQIHLTFLTISTPDCPSCGKKAQSCIYRVKPGNYTNPVPLTVTDPPSCSNWAISKPSVKLASNSSCGNSFNVTATGTNCTYYAVSNNDWIKNITYPSNGVVNYCIDENNDGERIGTISIKDGTNAIVGALKITQAAGNETCSYTISPKSNTNVPSTGKSGLTFDINTDDNCKWTASVSDDTWIRINSGNSGTGDGKITYSISKNPETTDRTGYIEVEGKTFNIIQKGGNTDCSYSISAESNPNVPSKGGSGYTFDVNTETGCDWSASVGEDTWITINSGSSGTGSGKITYSVESNPKTTTRTGYIKIKDKTFTVTQDAGKINCTYNLTPSSNSVPTSDGGTFTIDVKTESSCSWTASTNDDWITINSGSGLGNGTCQYTVSKNLTTSPKTGTIKIGDKDFTVSLPAGKTECIYTLSDYNSGTLPLEGGSGYSFNITANCSWKAITSDPWITLTTENAPGNGSCTYSVSRNNETSTRTGYIKVEDKTFTVIQASGNAKPRANFFSNENNIKPNTKIYFYDHSENIPTSWLWKFDGGTPNKSNEKNPVVTYENPGTYKVKLTVSNDLGSDSKTISGYITVSPDATNQLTPAYKNVINSPQLTHADPIQTGTGSYQYSHKDFSLPTVDGSVNFTRFYNTINNNLNGSLGYGWSHTYNYYIDIQRDDSTQTDTIWSVHYPDGHFADFIPYYDKQETYPRFCFALYSGTLDSLVKINSNEFVLYSKDFRQYHFNELGQLTQITDLNNNVTTISYTDNNISSVIGQGGRTITFSYSGTYLSSVSDPLNRNCNFTYDANGNLISSQDPNGGITKFKYDVNHRMTAFINSLGDTIVKNIYDEQGRVITQKDAYNQTTYLTYDTPSAGYSTITNPDKSQIVALHDRFFRKTNIKDELGFIKSYTYDYNGNETGFTNENDVSVTREFDWNRNITSQTTGSNIATKFEYNEFNSPIQITDHKGKSTTLSYDVKNNLISVQFPDKTFRYFTPNSDGTRDKLLDSRNNSTTYTYSKSGDVLSQTATNGTKLYDYDAAGRLISVTDENKHKTKISYDENDNIKVLTDALLRTFEFTYDANNQLLSTKDKNGNVTKYSYDKKGRLKTNTNPKGGVTSYNYDTRDNIISVTDPNGNVKSFTYDKKGRKLSTTDAFGVTKYEYDGVGNLTKVTDSSGKVTEYAYTATNKIKSVKDGLQNTTSFTYDENENLISTLNALNNSTVYSYDEMNRLVSVLDAANISTKITYDENGNKKTVTDPNGNTQSFSYDAANRLIRHFDALRYEIRYEYDNAENIRFIYSPTGTISKTYDESNRLLTVTNSSGDNYSFTYDKNDNITSMQNKTGTTVMVYDALNQLIQYTDPYNKTVSFTYDLMGNKTSVTYPGNHKVTYKYDSSNRLKTVTDWLNNTFTYFYDASGRNTQLIYPNGIKCDIEFDKAARILSKQNVTNNEAIINSSRFELDALGNRISELRQGAIPTNLAPSNKVYSYDETDAMKTNSVWNFTHDATGNRKTETKGNKNVKYSYSSDNLLTNITDTLGATTIYEYNPLRHRLSKKVGSNQLKYVLDLSSGLSMVLQITDASGAIKSEYVYGLGLLESIDPSNNVTFYHFDAQHNTTSLSNQNAAITDTYTYDPFGTVLTHTGNSKQPFTFLGEFGVEQENTSLYFVRARYYDAANGRFLSRDVYPGDLINPQTINRYVYGINNPNINFDPTGLLSWSSLGIAMLQFVAASGQIATTTLELWTLPKTVILGSSGVLSAGESFNESTKNFQAAGANFMNFINSNDNWVDSDEIQGALDAIGFDNSSVMALRDANSIFSALKDINKITDNVINSPGIINKIINSNYSNNEKLGFVLKYLFSSVNQNPIRSSKDYIDGLKGSYNLIPDIFNAVNKAKTGK